MDIEFVLKLAGTCSSRTDFAKKHSYEYTWLSKKGLMSHLDSVLPSNKGGRPRVERSLEKSLAAARLCVNRVEFNSRFKHDFTWLSNHGLLRELDVIYGAPKCADPKVITLESARAELKESPNRFHFISRRKASYMWLKKNNLLSELDAVHPLSHCNELTLEGVSVLFKQCQSRREFSQNYRREYYWLKDHNLLCELDKVFPLPQWNSAAIQTWREMAWTEEELTADALRFKSREEWKAAKSGYSAAVKRGRAFMRQCCAHMPKVKKLTRLLYSDADVLASAKKYCTRNAWKIGNTAEYMAALRRPVWDECVAHMLPAANPFARDYVIYAAEFADRFCYVGLSVVIENRKQAHACRGPVFNHATQTGLQPEFKILESNLLYTEAGAAEDRWQATYASEGWQPLHSAKAGSLGGIHDGKWTREAVLADARKFATKQAWIDGSQGSYRTAKREGWFEEACAHMPRRKLGVGVGRTVSQETRQRQREAKLGSTHTPEQRAARSDAKRCWWADRRTLAVENPPGV